MLQRPAYPLCIYYRKPPAKPAVFDNKNIFYDSRVFGRVQRVEHAVFAVARQTVPDARVGICADDKAAAAAARPTRRGTRADKCR